MFIDIHNVPIEPLQKKIAERYSFKSRNESNFVPDCNSHIACFTDGPKPLTGLFFVTDENFKPLLCFKTNAYIEGCSISETGKFALVKTFGNNGADEDGNAIIILDVENAKEIARPQLETGWFGNLLIDEKAEILSFRQDDFELRYTFDGTLLDKDILRKYYELPNISVYALDKRVNSLLDEIGECGHFIADVKDEIYSLLERLKASFEMSHYQLSLTYKRLGAVLAKQGDIAEAIAAYETGLILNPKLAVKRELGKLKKDNPDITTDAPTIYSIEMEKLWEADDYMLPPTAGGGEQKAVVPPTTYKDMAAYRNASDAERAFIDESAKAMFMVGKSFLESLETDAYKFCKGIPNLNTMSEAEFGVLFNGLCSRLDKEVRKTARKTSEQIILRHKEDDTLSIRQEIILNLHSMILSYTGVNL